MAVALRPLSTGELLDRVFSLYRAHFALFVGIVALPHLITLALQLFVGVRLSPPGFGISAMLGTFLWAMLLGVAALVVGAASQAAAVVALSQAGLMANEFLDRAAIAAVNREIPKLASIVVKSVNIEMQGNRRLLRKFGEDRSLIDAVLGHAAISGPLPSRDG